jgi:hypothetical protein
MRIQEKNLVSMECASKQRISFYISAVFFCSSQT